MSEFKDRVLDFQNEEVNLWQFSQAHLFPHELYNSGILSETKFNLRPRRSEEKILDKQTYLQEFQTSEYRNQLTLTLLHLKLVFIEGDELRKELVELIELIEENLEKVEN